MMHYCSKAYCWTQASESAAPETCCQSMCWNPASGLSSVCGWIGFSMQGTIRSWLRGSCGKMLINPRAAT